MTVLVVHDPEGNLLQIVVSPVDPPPLPRGFVLPEEDPDLAVTEVEAPEISELDLSDQEGRKQLREVLEQFRVEVKTEARLVRKLGE
jgi:hypothetical protein